MSSGKKNSRWSRLAGSSSSSNSEDFYSTNSSAMALTQDTEIERQSLAQAGKQDQNGQREPQVPPSPPSSPLARSNSKANRGLVGRLRKMANSNKADSYNSKSKKEFETHLEDSTTDGRLNKYSTRREDAPLASTQEVQDLDSRIKFPRNSVSSSPSSPSDRNPLTHQRTPSGASMSSLSSRLLFGHFAASIASSSDHGSIRSSVGSEEDDGASESLPNLGAMDFNIASDFGVVDSATEPDGGNGKGKGKAVLKGQLPPSVAMALKDSGKEKTPRLVYGDGGASASASSVLKGNRFDSIGRASGVENERMNGHSSSQNPSQIDDTASIATSSEAGGSHSRIRSLEPSLIGFSMEDEGGEDVESSFRLEEKLSRMASTRQRRDSVDSAGTIKEELKEDGDKSMPGSFFFSPPAKSSIPVQEHKEATPSSTGYHMGSPSWDGGEPEEEPSPTEGADASDAGTTFTARTPVGDAEDPFSYSRSAEPSEAYHSLEPSLDDSASIITTSAIPNSAQAAHAIGPSTTSSSDSGSFRTLSAEDVRTNPLTGDVVGPVTSPFVSRRKTVRRPAPTSESQNAIPASQRWLKGNKTFGESSQEKKHYFVKEMVRKELRWEFERAWLFDVENKREKVQDSDDDFSIFQSSDQQDQEPPSLPLVEFLFERVFSSFPLFKTHESDCNDLVFAPKDYFKETVLPLLSARQKLSLSSRVDRQGEGDGTPFSSRTTLDGLKAVIEKWLVNYLTSVFKVDPHQATSTLQDGKRPVSWPAPDLLPPEAFLACRKPNLNALRQGGMEITFDSMRVRRGENGFFAVDYMLCIQRPNRRKRFVVRNEPDFEQFAVSIAKELGKDSKVRSLPARGDYSESDDEYEEASDPNSNRQQLKNLSLTSALSSRLNLGKSSTTLNTLSNNRSSSNLGRKSSFGRSTSSLVRRRSRSNSSSAAAPPVDTKSSRQFSSDATGRSSRLRRFSVKSPGGQAGDESDSESWERQPNLNASRTGLSSAPSTPGVEEKKQIEFDFSGGSKSQRSSIDLPKSSSGINFGSLNFGNKSRTSLKPKASQGFGRSTSSLVGPVQDGEKKENGGGSGRSSQDSKKGRPNSLAQTSKPNLPDLPNKRRRRLRAWLRDTLSIRGAVDTREARDFLSIGGFLEQDLKPSDRSAMSAVKAYDERRRAQREEDEKIAGEEILGLRETIDRIKEDCQLGDGFPKTLWAIQRNSTFASLPVPYQQILSYTNLRLARFLHGTFVVSNVSRGNLARARDLFASIPWATLSLAFKEPTGKMLEMIQDEILKPSSVQNILAILLEDNEPTSLDEQLYELKNSIHSGMMSKIERFVESDDQHKRIVRDHAERSGIPLVAAIVRGAEEPRLSDSEIEKVITASEKYQEFMSTQPSVVRQRANKTSEYLLIARLQRALRLLSLQRDGSKIRSAMQDPSVAACLANLFSPINEILVGLRGVDGSSSSILQLQSFLKRVLDLLSALRARVLDPAQALNEISDLLDQGTPAWYAFLHKASLSPSSKRGIECFFEWANDLAVLTASGSPDLAQFWSKKEEVSSEQINRDSEAILAFAKRKRNRQFELACRWVAGKTDSDLSIQVHGDGLGSGRIHPFFPREPRPLSQKNTQSLGILRPDFSKACKLALEKLADSD